LSSATQAFLKVPALILPYWRISKCWFIDIAAEHGSIGKHEKVYSFQHILELDFHSGAAGTQYCN